ncbi:uncharacterized protein LOC114250288 [Bombyx mandarina]|uniref:Uncharacterized protein LOC114250288 n=1 Tax=Bombyx mandarina TaxID=7092 RepID=A0A6J2KG31_BOMMA|nr:uncharacterized protein LOC114250288 [Bombyx mandarina]
MKFERVFPEEYPSVYSKWKDGYVEWVIQDLPPEDDEEAIKILVDHLCADETLCKTSDLLNDPESVRGISEFWRIFLGKRMSLGCYASTNGNKKLVALNCCFVSCKGEDIDCEIVGKAWKNVYDVLDYAVSKFDVFEYLGTDKVLEGMGLVVSRNYRGAKLGSKIIAAREPLCYTQGIKATATVFTGIASQKCAESCGFVTTFEFPLSELAEIGLNYSKDDTRLIKLMVKKYDF